MQFSDNNNLCAAMREYKSNDILTEKRRQQLRANNHDLRQLERHLRSAALSKELMEQQKSAIKLREDQLRKKQEENEKFVIECELARKSMLCQKKAEKLKKEMLLETLKNQIGDMQKQRLQKLDDAKKDKRDMEQLIKQIHLDDNFKQKDAALLREKYRKEMEETYHDKRLRQQAEKERSAIENVRILDYLRTCDEIKSEQEAERKKLQKEKEDLSEFLGNQLSSINSEKEKRENLLLSLLIEERRAKEDNDFKESLIKQSNESKKFRFEIERYRYENQIQKEKKFKEEEEEFRETNLSYLEERDKLWQLSEEKRRLKRMEHRKALREMIEQRRYQKAKNISDQIADFEKIKTDVEKCDQKIEEERMIMLSSVPRDLLGYLPPGVLKKSDREFLNVMDSK